MIADKRDFLLCKFILKFQSIYRQNLWQGHQHCPPQTRSAKVDIQFGGEGQVEYSVIVEFSVLIQVVNRCEVAFEHPPEISQVATVDNNPARVDDDGAVRVHDCQGVPNAVVAGQVAAVEALDAA